MLLTDILFPRVCPVCGEVLLKDEHYLCLACEVDFPLTFFWNWSGNPAEMLFWGRLKEVKASALFYYREGSDYKEIVHKFKYNGERKMGLYFAQMLGVKMRESGRFADIDYVIPVPLHFYKRWRRGFNQAEIIAEGVAQELGKPVLGGVLVRSRYTATQTKKDPEERWKNVFEAFRIRGAEKVEGKHILLVDDVLTTGATIEACGRHLEGVEGCRVSVATLGFVE